MRKYRKPWYAACVCAVDRNDASAKISLSWPSLYRHQRHTYNANDLTQHPAQRNMLQTLIATVRTNRARAQSTDGRGEHRKEGSKKTKANPQRVCENPRPRGCLQQGRVHRPLVQTGVLVDMVWPAIQLRLQGGLVTNSSRWLVYTMCVLRPALCIDTQLPLPNHAGWCS
jgi:hypothetical protein